MEKAVKTDMEYREILEKSLSAIQYLMIKIERREILLLN
jgi:hypothetical protein|nr:MAG TPA: hypothetical protein [Caudoviricetes sp.]